MLAAADLAARAGAERFVPGGHSFGGAIARAGRASRSGSGLAGVVTFATQSAGCEGAGRAHRTAAGLPRRPRRAAPAGRSEVVAELAGGEAEVTVCEGAGHLLTEAADELRAEVPVWVRARLDQASS